MTKYLLDTDICIEYLRNRYHLRQKLESVGYSNCFVSEITIAELMYGAHKSGNYEKHRGDAYTVMSITTVMPIFQSLDLYGKERARLEKLGTKLPSMDLLIGTTAVHHNMILVTNNTKHMERIENIQLENWLRAADNEFLQK